jgi:predicted oxidoreductase
MGFGGDDCEGRGAAIGPALAALDAACEAGIRLFDHADIYRDGRAEEVFGEWLKARPGLRERICIQSKCGVRAGRYDLSKPHILAAVDGSLRRLGTPYLDILLLHRPDPLMEPMEVAETFALLESAGKVRHFGVSNMNVHQVRLLQQALPQPLVVNQLEMSLAKLDWVEEGVHVNQQAGARVHFAEGLLEHCRHEVIQLQAWAPLARGLFSGRAIDDAPPHVRQTAQRVREMADDKGTTPESIVLGWLMRHPAAIQPIIGTTRPERIAACRDAVRITAEFSREDWYSLYVLARGGTLP